MAANAKKPGVKTIGQGVQVKELKAGNGPMPKASDVVKINYVGKTIEGKVFDQRNDATMPVGGVIPGFTEALTKMPVGSKWRLLSLIAQVMVLNSQVLTSNHSLLSSLQ